MFLLVPEWLYLPPNSKGLAFCKCYFSKKNVEFRVLKFQTRFFKIILFLVATPFYVHIVIFLSSYLYY